MSCSNNNDNVDVGLYYVEYNKNIMSNKLPDTDDGDDNAWFVNWWTANGSMTIAPRHTFALRYNGFYKPKPLAPPRTSSLYLYLSTSDSSRLWNHHDRESRSCVLCVYFCCLVSELAAVSLLYSGWPSDTPVSTVHSRQSPAPTCTLVAILISRSSLSRVKNEKCLIIIIMVYNNKLRD